MSSKSTTTKCTLDPANPPVLTPEQARRLDESPIDYSDIPELPPGFWAKYRPVLAEQKAQITLRIDQDVLDFFRAQGTSPIRGLSAPDPLRSQPSIKGFPPEVLPSSRLRQMALWLLACRPPRSTASTTRPSR